MKRNNFKHILALFLGVIILSSSVLAYADEPANTKNEIMNYENEHPIDQGAVSYSYIENGVIEITQTLGYVDLSGDKIENTNDSVFQWGNASGILVWISLMQLMEQGKINYERTITDYLPEEYITSVQFTYPITVKNLMNHSSGFQENLYERYVLEGVEITPLINLLINNCPKQIYEPGVCVAYSEYAVCLGALMVSNVSGLPYEEYVHENILKPLSMDQTSVKADYSDNEFVNEKRLATKSYQNGELYTTASYLSPFYPANMAASTITDFAKLNLALLDKTSGLFEKEETYDTFLSSSLNYRNTDDIRIAHGLFAYEYEESVLGIVASSRTNQCVFYLKPESGQGLVVMTNIIREKEYCQDLAKVVFGEKTGKKTGEFTNSIGDYEGIYLASNTIVKGKLSFYSMFNSLKLKDTGNDALGLSAYNNYPYFTQIDDDRAVMEDGMVVHFTTLSDNSKIIELPHMDLIPFSGLQYYMGYVLFFAQILSYLFATLVLIGGFGLFVYRKIKKEEGKPHTFRKYMYIQCLNVTLFTWVFLYMVASAISYSSQLMINASSLMYWLGSLVSVVYILFMFRTGRNEPVSGKEKGLYYATSATGLIMVLFAIFYRLILLG
ncbi:MAG: serine hydrolase [Lachnospiraceae bacterium]|nr:serine hydrolase [Lachnospiraceae bacterium]